MSLWVAVIGLSALALVLVLTSPWIVGTWSADAPGNAATAPLPETGRRDLVTALGDRRPVEPRLSGGFAYAPCVRAASTAEDLIPLARCSRLPSPGSDEFRRLFDVGSALRSPTSGAATGPRLHTRGLWHLLWVDQDESVDRAVDNLEAAATLSAANDQEAARTLSDLAAAYLVRAATEDRPLDLILALDASGRALEATPGLPEALFNHALAIEALQLRNEARAAWEDVLNAEPAGPWADEAREHLRALGQPTVLEAWEAERPLLERAARQGDDEEVRRLVTTFGPPVRDWIEEELLPAWGEAELAGDQEEAADLLTVARTSGGALARAIGEHLPADTVAAIDRAGAQERRTLAEGHRAFGRGMERYKAHDCSAATRRFTEAEARFDAGGSPFAARAVLQESICSYYRVPERTRKRLESLRTALPPNRYPTVEGRTAWMIGLCQGDQGRPAAALESYRSGVEALQTIGDPDAGALYGYVATVEEALGQTRSAWNGRLTALTILARQADPRRLYNALHAIVGSLLTEDRPDLAVHFQDELLAEAQAWSEPGPLADAFLTRSRIRLALGNDRDALADLREAETTAATVPDGEIRNRLEADLDAGLGQALAPSRPAEAIETLTESIERYRAVGHVARVPDLLVSRARASLARHDVDAAEKDLDQAIREQEARRHVAKTDAEGRIGLFAHAQEAYDAMIALRLDRRQDALAALRWSDRARGRELSVTLAPSEGLPANEDELLRRVPAGVTAVEYTVLPDRLILWILGRELRTVVRPLPEAALGRSVDALCKLIEARAPEDEIRNRSAPLFEALVRPVVELAEPGDTLVLVPDRALHRLPFAALWDARSGSYLIEHHAIAQAPSLALALAGPHRRPRAETPSTILAVGASVFDRDRFPNLPPLPQAEDEARTVAALYPRPEVLAGAAATPDALTELAPEASILHIAGHALVDADHPARSELVLAPPGAGSGRGTVTAERLSRLPLGGVELVYLSACRTVSELPFGTREGPGGLARAALVAGAPAVVANRWEVDDTAALAMAIAFHGRYARGASAIAALRAAQRALLSDERSSIHHPASWSGFSILVASPSLLDAVGNFRPIARK